MQQSVIYIIIAVVFASDLAISSMINKKRRELDLTTEAGRKANTQLKFIIVQFFISSVLISALLLYMF